MIEKRMQRKKKSRESYKSSDLPPWFEITIPCTPA
jgi:hypothetical protein